MKAEIWKLVAAVSALGQLASCAQSGPLEVANGNTSVTSQTTATYVPNNSIARGDESKLKERPVKHLWSSCGRCCLAGSGKAHIVSPSSH